MNSTRESRLKEEISTAIEAHARQDSSAPPFASFRDWEDVLEEASRGAKLWYQAPLDRNPRAIRVVKVFKNGKIRIDPMSNQADLFTADEGHLDRFRRRVVPIDPRVPLLEGDRVWCNGYRGVVAASPGSHSSRFVEVRLARGVVVADPKDPRELERRT